MHAKMLYAMLHAFSLETVNPTAKAMWTQLATNSLQIVTSIEKRNGYLLEREDKIKKATALDD